MSYLKEASKNHVNGSKRKDNTKNLMTSKKTLDNNVDDADEKEINLTTLQTLSSPSVQRNTTGLLNDIVNHSYRVTFAELVDQMRAEDQMKKAAHRNIKKFLFGMDLQCLRYDDSSDDIPDNESFELSEGDETKKENSDSEEAKSTEEAQQAEKYNLDFNLLFLKLEALEQSYESKVNNWQDGYDGSIESETEHSCKGDLIRNNEVYSEESQESLVDNDNEVGHGTMKNENIEFMETKKHGNVSNRSNVPQSAKNTSKEQNEIIILEAELEPLNESKVNLFSPKFNEPSFLRTALGDEMNRTDIDQKSNSISTDDLNYLLSVAYCQNNQTSNSGASVLSNESFTTGYNSYSSSPNSYPSYEEVTGFGFNPNTDEGQKNIQKHININEEIVKQVMELLVFGCQNRSQFVGSYIHLDAEKILLVAKARLNALLDNLYVPLTTEPLARETAATMALEKFGIQLRICFEPLSPKVKQYYMCILEHKTTVYSTGIKVANECGCINFGDRFVFENVANTFNIKVSLYSLTVKVSTSKCTRTSLLKRRPQVPMMTLSGVTHIGLLNAKNRKFSLKNAVNITGPEHKLLTTVEVTLHWPKLVKGFLTLGFSRLDRQPRWNKRWTILEDGQLKYFNFPSDELFCAPVGIVDVRKCASIIETSSVEYMMKKTLMLVFNSNQNSLVKLYICADTRKEQLMWLEKFKAIIQLKTDWSELEN